MTAPKIAPVRRPDEIPAAFPRLHRPPLRIGDWCTFNTKPARVVSVDDQTVCIADGEAMHWVPVGSVVRQ